MARQQTKEKRPVVSDGRSSFRPVGANLVIGLKGLASGKSNMQANYYMAKVI
jgi:hypothetical protein